MVILSSIFSIFGIYHFNLFDNLVEKAAQVERPSRFSEVGRLGGSPIKSFAFQGCPRCECPNCSDTSLQYLFRHWTTSFPLLTLSLMVSQNKIFQDVLLSCNKKNETKIRNGINAARPISHLTIRSAIASDTHRGELVPKVRSGTISHAQEISSLATSEKNGT